MNKASLPSATKLRRLCFYRRLSVHRGGGVCLNACWDTTPREQTPPRSRHPPDQTPYPPGADPPSGADTPQSRPTPSPPEQTHPPRSRHPPRERRPLLRTVRILMECILVLISLLHFQKSVFPDLLATSGDYLRVWRAGESDTRLECLLNNVSSLDSLTVSEVNE